MIYELYGPTEGQAATALTGMEWLEHPGSVGTAKVGEVSDMHPAVLASCCVGIPDADLGTVPALVVETVTGELPADLDGHLAEHLSKVKRTRRIVATSSRLRDAAGKIRKRDIKDEFLSV